MIGRLTGKVETVTLIVGKGNAPPVLNRHVAVDLRAVPAMRGVVGVLFPDIERVCTWFAVVENGIASALADHPLLDTAMGSVVLTKDVLVQNHAIVGS